MKMGMMRQLINEEGKPDMWKVLEVFVASLIILVFLYMIALYLLAIQY